MADSLDGQAGMECDCLTLAVRDVESFARGRLHRTLEKLVIYTLMAISRPFSGLAGVPDLSLGPYQLKVSTVAKFRSAPMSRQGRWLLLEREAAQQVVAECFVEAQAAGHARRRIHEALEYGESVGMDRFAATAMLYSGELPTAFFNPYQTRLRARYLVRHRRCGAVGGAGG
jgi:hypothetical protein